MKSPPAERRSVNGRVWLAAALGMCWLPPAPRLPAADSPAPSPPVILLTGFEPFGPGRPANPSWEGIKALDGQRWQGYQLVCKQMKVVWGSPLEQLQQWIRQCHPVAIFSFGQGRDGAFSLETRASNQRDMLPDNQNKLPSQPAIVKAGPETLRASSDCRGLARLLAAKGYPVNVSQDAGRYLCEEALYSLEYLRSRHAVASVLFCHVPSLGSTVGDRPVNAPFVQQFVRDALEAWRTLGGVPGRHALPPSRTMNK